MNQVIITASYIGATVLFILALGGLSKQETARRGNFYGIAGVSICSKRKIKPVKILRPRVGREIISMCLIKKFKMPQNVDAGDSLTSVMPSTCLA